MLNGELDGLPSLEATYCSPAKGLQIRLSTEFSSLQAEQAEATGVGEVVAGQFAEFRHMVNSVRIEPGTGPMASLPAASSPTLGEWPVHRHETLGVEVRYPPGWQVDSQEWFVWFTDGPQAAQTLNIANANFGMTQPKEFLAHLGVPVEMTRTLLLDGHPARWRRRRSIGAWWPWSHPTARI